MNHPKGNPAGPRDYQDRIGTIRSVAVRPGEGLFGDFHFNPKHALAEQLMWDAEHAPENVGFSHNVEARVGRRGDRVVVEAITRVQSVDLVADPATTRGLFESAARRRMRRQRPTPLTLDDLKRDHPELVESIRQEQAAELSRLQEEVERLTALEAAHQKRDMARRLLARVRSARSRGDRAVGEDDRQRAVSSSRSWRRPTSRRCAPWSRSGRGWCGRSPAATACAVCRTRGRSRAISTWCMPPARWTRKSFVEAIT